jgi:hypothetical protein
MAPVAILGGIPNKHVDIPVTSVFLFLFIISAASHMTIFKLNLRRGRKFVFSAMLFGFSMARIITCILRIAWATRPAHVPLAIASTVFNSAGVVIIFIINLLFALRITRAQHPRFGWHRLLHFGFIAYFVSIAIMLIALITCVVQSFYTLNGNTHRIDRDVQLTGSVYFTVSAFLPILMVVFGLIVPRKTRVEKFGNGRFRTKIHILLAAAVLLTLGASFRAGTAFRLRPINHPAWYHSKACFYIFNFSIEIIVLYLYVALRIDHRFHIPDGSKRPGDYSGQNQQKDELHVDSDHDSQRQTRIFSEEEVFDDVPSEEIDRKSEERSLHLAPTV